MFEFEKWNLNVYVYYIVMADNPAADNSESVVKPLNPSSLIQLGNVWAKHVRVRVTDSMYIVNGL